MKTRIITRSFLTLIIAAAVSFAARNVPAQDSAPAAGAAAAAPQLSYGVSQIIQLSKADVGEDTVINYVKNSGNSYGLDADQIVYLKQQGVSANVINAMINQVNRPVASAPAPADSPANYTAPVVQTAPAAAPASTVYVMPDTQTANYYAYYYHPYYAGYYYPYYYSSGYYGYYGWPAVSVNFGYGGYRGGYHGVYNVGNWHGGGGMRGGGWHR